MKNTYMTQVGTTKTHQTLATAGQVDTRIDEMATEIMQWRDENPLFVCFLKGGAPFASQLMFAVARLAAESGDDYHPDLDYMTISTYGTGREAKEPRVVMDLAPGERVRDRLVVMLDDVLDTGTTMDFAERLFQSRGAKAVKSAVLVEKENKRAVYERGADLVGFKSPAKLWLTGMGMDDAKTSHEANRWSGKIEIVN